MNADADVVADAGAGAGTFATQGRSENDGARIHVVAGLIYSHGRDKLLIAKRPTHSHQGGLWEFPGGKVAAGEPAYRALCRELREELGIEVTAATLLLSENHDYPDKSIRLESWAVEGFTGSARGNEGQEIAWVAVDDLEDYHFPAANRSILDRIANQSARS